jgi:sialate O-acetylesterase
MFHRTTVLAALVMAITALVARAELTLPSYYSDHMVLQRDVKLPIWGRAKAGEAVTVKLDDQAVTGAVKPDGEFVVELPAMKEGGPHTLTIDAGGESKTFKDVLIGDVWVCAGQSNMEFGVGGALNAAEEIKSANQPTIRLLSIPAFIVPTKATELKTHWSECTPQTAAGFSAVGYFFGRQINKEIGVPVGLIGSYWGGTVAEAWTSPKGMQREEVKPIADRYAAAVAAYETAAKDYQAKLAAWKAASEKAAADGTPAPAKPAAPVDPRTVPNFPSNLFNSKIAPLTRFPIKGVIWYQGESNAGFAWMYRYLFPVMINSWRDAWGQGNFPFLFVQLANFGPVKPEPSESAWAELREAQQMSTRLPKTGMAVTIDIGEANDIHPKNKQEVARRLVLLVHKIAYDKTKDEKYVFCGPVWDTQPYAVQNGGITLGFYQTGSGLATRGGGPVKGFAISGRDHKWHWADAVIEEDGKHVRVSSKEVPKPFVVRYAWADSPEANLINKEGLPAGPFRTDAWNGITKPKDAAE